MKINGVQWRERQKRARQSFPVMGFGLCLREQRGSSHVSCAEGRASRAVNAAEVEGSVIPWLLAILTAFSPSLPFSFLSLSLASLSQNPERACRNHSGSSTQLQVCYLTHAVIFYSFMGWFEKNRCRKELTFSTNCWSF